MSSHGQDPAATLDVVFARRDLAEAFDTFAGGSRAVDGDVFAGMLDGDGRDDRTILGDGSTGDAARFAAKVRLATRH